MDIEYYNGTSWVKLIKKEVEDVTNYVLENVVLKSGELKFRTSFPKEGYKNLYGSVVYGKERTVGDFYIKTFVQKRDYEINVSLENEQTIEVGDTLEFAVDVIANDYVGETLNISGSISPYVNDGGIVIEKFDGENWNIVDNLSVSNFTLADTSFKYRLTFCKTGNFTVQFNDISKNVSVIYNPETSNQVATIGDIYYSDLNKAIKNAKDSDVIYLLKDTNISSSIVINKEIANLYLDLNKHTITAANNINAILVDGNVKFTVKNGNIVVSGTGSGIQAVNGANLVVEDGVKITTDWYGIAVFNEGTQLDFNGQIEVLKDGYGILGNGSVGNGGTTILTGNTAKIIANYDTGDGSFAFYLPQEGTVNINGGYFEADTVFGIKSGTLNINGGEFVATGTKTAPQKWSNGIKGTGDVILIEENASYADNISINVSDSVIENMRSEQGYLIQENIADKGLSNVVKANLTKHKISDNLYYYDRLENVISNMSSAFKTEYYNRKDITKTTITPADEKFNADLFYVEVGSFLATDISDTISINDSVYTNGDYSISIGNANYIKAPIYKVENNKLYVAFPWLIAESMPNAMTTISIGDENHNVKVLKNSTTSDLQLTNIVGKKVTGEIFNAEKTGDTSISIESSNGLQYYGLVLTYGGVELTDVDVILYRLDSNKSMGMTTPEKLGETMVTYASYPWYYEGKYPADYVNKVFPLTYKIGSPEYGIININISFKIVE